jgi:putative thioredoxin
LAWQTLARDGVSWLVASTTRDIYGTTSKARMPAMDYIIGQKPGQGGARPGKAAPGEPAPTARAPRNAAAAPAAAPARASAAAPRDNGAAPIVADGDQSSFMRDVVDASREVPVIVDFWATWCGPCKTLTPLLEKVVRGAGGRVRLVKIDIDKNQALVRQLAQLGLPLQSVPTVAAFWQGQIADLFQGALPESEVKRFVEALLKLAGGAMPQADLIAEGRAALERGDPQEAGELFAAALQQEPERPDAWGGLIRALVAMEDAAQAHDALEQVPAKLREHAEIAGARSALALYEEGRRAKQMLGAFLDRLAADPTDSQARYDLATALNAVGRREEAAEALLHIIRTDRKWHDDAARLQLLKFFEAWGFDDPATMVARRKLSALLFR